MTLGPEDPHARAYARAAEEDSSLRWHEFPRRWPRNRYEAAAQLCTGGGSLLELGFGDGLFLHNIASRFDRITGVDFVPRRVQMVSREFQKREAGKNIELITHSLEDNLPQRLNGERFDWIAWSDVIEHVVDLWRLFNDLTKLSKPGGWLVTVTPNVAYLPRRLALLTGRFPSTSGADEGFSVPDGELFDGGHVHYFTYRAVEKLHRMYGFDTDIARLGYGRMGRIHNVVPSVISPGIALRSRRGT